MLRSAKNAISSAASHINRRRRGLGSGPITLQGPDCWNLSITGSQGSADISADISTGNLDDLVSAINVKQASPEYPQLTRMEHWSSLKNSMAR